MYERKPWSIKVTSQKIQEDQTLRQLKQVRKIQKWSEIANRMREQFQIFGRNGKQCRERYHNHLDSRITKHKWDPMQENKLLDLHNIKGNRWAAISRELKGRTDNCVKNHFYSCFRKGIKVANALINKFCKKKMRPLKIAIIAKIVSVIESYHKQSKQFDQSFYQKALMIKNQILDIRNDETVLKEIAITKLQNISKQIGEFNKVCRKRISKKKLSKPEKDNIADRNNRILSQKQFQQSQNQNFQDTVKEQMIENIESEEKVKIQVPSNTKVSEPARGAYQQVYKTTQQFMHTPIKNREKQEKQKSSSFCALKSIDYLDGKIGHQNSVRQFIYMDEEKEWKLYFE